MQHYNKEDISAYFELTKDIPYLGLMGMLWSVYCEDFGEIDQVVTELHYTIYDYVITNPLSCMNNKPC